MKGGGAGCLAALALLSLVGAGCPPGGPARGGRPGGGGALDGGASSGPAGVIVFEAYLRQAPEGGATLGLLQPDTVVRLGEERRGWRAVEVAPPDLLAQGWVRADRVGCRALRPVSLAPLEEGGVEAELRPGALLAVTGRRGELLEVETRDPVSLRGLVPAEACGVGEPFVPLLPRDGTLFVLGRETVLLRDEAGGGPISTLPQGFRFVVQGPATSGFAVGRTDGAVVVRGRVDRSALEEDPRSTPLDRLAEPLGYSHESVLEADLRVAPDGDPASRLPAGCPLNVLERRGDWSRVRSVGRVQLEGWVQTEEIRRVALDHNELEPGARRRSHAPVDREWIHEGEGEEERPDGAGGAEGEDP